MTTTFHLPCENGRAILTTEHAASSYGQPVLVWRGVAYGPADRLPLAGWEAAPTGYELVAAKLLTAFSPASPQAQMVDRFCRQPYH